mgnify:CR=1 FL=1
MTLLDQCKIWNENDEYQKIIEALEAVPAQERTPEMDSELARAYNNQAAPGDRELFRKAIALLKPHEAYFAGDHCWNFRMGYSYYYLDQEGRALPYFLKVKELLDGGSVGQPLTAEVRLLRPERPEDRDPARLPWRLRREVGGEGYFHDLAPHTLDILDFLLGEITDARGCKSNRGGFYDVADTVAASFRFRSGVPGTGMWCFVAPPSAAEDSVVVTGRKGSVRFSTFDFTPVELVTARGVERFEIAPPEHIQGPLIETIVRELRGEGVCPSTGVSAARTSRVMDEIMKE